MCRHSYGVLAGVSMMQPRISVWAMCLCPDGATVTMALSRAAASEFIQAGIQKFTVYVYKVERRGSALFMEKGV